MNIQDIFEALEDDSKNSGLGIICGELEFQGYLVAIDGQPVNSTGFYNNEYPHLEQQTEPFSFTLYNKGEIEQEFILEFIDYHEIILKRKPI
ncbi:MAG: hypothetical protein QNI92_02290 [Desulfobacterales bacterium]|nr:hypothetical protein [Desulfobacterales bacterium]MDJ0913009.1 hypothetical protein [Desulfobacterales bacterium]